ncbi:MAG TPA: transcriptional regulator [Terriglobales bacterium]|nr:transcriptional regulator [Terriglobales bacterium]
MARTRLNAKHVVVRQHTQQRAAIAKTDDFPELDRLIHERMRLGIVSALAVNQSLSFNDLKRLLKTTDGNISVHARKLEEASYITCHKFFEGRMPRTEYQLTPTGKKAFDEYLVQMEDLVRRMKEH